MSQSSMVPALLVRCLGIIRATPSWLLGARFPNTLEEGRRRPSYKRESYGITFLCMQSKYSKLWACQKDSSKLCWGKVSRRPTRRKTFFKALFIQETMSMMAPRKVGDGHAESDRLELGGDFHFFLHITGLQWTSDNSKECSMTP